MAPRLHRPIDRRLPKNERGCRFLAPSGDLWRIVWIGQKLSHAKVYCWPVL